MNTLDILRKEAKFWLKQVRDNHSGFSKRLRLAYPGTPATPGLRDIQHALAREHGYKNWKALTAGLATEPAPAPQPDTGDLVSNFLRFACWDHHVHGQGDYRSVDAAAMRLLRKHPEIATANIYTAVVCGEAATVERLLAARPDLVNQKGGVRGWEPLLYLCYARLSLDVARDNALYIASLLLDRGANANAYYMAGHSVYGTLVGVVGEGEQEAPPHPRREELYRLLLERGAEPYDIQVLYNTHFGGNALWWLKLEYDHSVATGHAADWDDPDLAMLDMGGYGTGAGFLFWVADTRHTPELREWLLARGADPQSTRRTLARPKPEHPLLAAVQRDDVEAVARALDDGVAVTLADADGTTGLHMAAAHNAVGVARLLLDRGADPNTRESRHHATPLGFACYHDHRAMIDLLAAVSRDIWCLGGQGKVERLREVLAVEPERARQIAPDGTTPLWWLPDEEPVALEVVELLLAHGADPAVTAKNGRTAADSARVLGLDRIAARLEAAILRSG